ncbi:uncharacterized protein PFL1_05175 [Pseudozyma flocculosa PF-1]|uniref:Chromo domain-containing protein n=2 Tax=Pseudozyma flocculosa TaxID=84751 RepID=A0A5C3F8E7_9BASI|nr:uncharacterized protein PFL1_05175 [Pseudozyma flocculosa PF-1]EPQ27252.1 hypothetical protein PFL1_05175 [Pseudozyma flocculosa PF-1]SPO39621.1 uncharacterized protein PSFLO_05102 [Pseudozyma flocculosa]
MARASTSTSARDEAIDLRSPPSSPRASKRIRTTKEEAVDDSLAAAAAAAAATTTTAHVDTATSHPLPNEVAITPDLQLPLNQDVLDTFLYWCHERHRIHTRRRQGKPREQWTDDPIFKSNKFANVFRVLDRGTQFVLTDVIAKGDQSLEECCFRVILFRSFARISTYELITEALGGPPSYRSFSPELYDNILLPHIGAGKPIYGSSYYIPAPKEFKSQYPFQGTLRLISLMMRTGLPQKLADLKHMRDAHAAICVYPSIGAFLGMQLLLDLNLTPHIDVSEDEYAACGPGSRSCLVSMFGSYVQGFELQAMQWIYKQQHDHWLRMGITDPPQLCDARPPGLNMVDIEHALCEVHKYMRERDRKANNKGRKGAKRGGRALTARQRSVAASSGAGAEAGDQDGTGGFSPDRIKGEGALAAGGEPATIDDEDKKGYYSLFEGDLTYTIPEKWLVPQQQRQFERPPPLSATALKAEAQDERVALDALASSAPPADQEGEAEVEGEGNGEVYEISHIVTMSQASTKCLVRWKGFGPDDDTWEDLEQLMEGDARESVEAYLAWPQKVADEIERMQGEAKEERERLRNADLDQLIARQCEGGSAAAAASANLPIAASMVASRASTGQVATRSMRLPLSGPYGVV